MINFTKHDTMYYYCKKDSKISKTKFATFDLDHTLIKPKSGSKFPKDEHDWVFCFENVKEVLTNYYNRGYHICIFTNQLGIKKKPHLLEQLRLKLNTIRDLLGLPFDIYISTDEDYYRKPNTGMWKFFSKSLMVKKAFYCGDACGRKNDFSDSDYNFAFNNNIVFKTPENIFGNDSHFKIPSYISFDVECKPLQIKKRGRHLIIMIGPPASGKSSLSKTTNYNIINMDTLKTKAKCMKTFKEHILKHDNIVIDNTNPSLESRSEYLKCAKDNSYHCTAIVMKTSKEICNHLNYYRVEKSMGKIRRIPAVAYNVYYSKYIPPTIEEGFDEVIEYSPKLDHDVMNYRF